MTCQKLTELFWVDFLINVQNIGHFWSCSILYSVVGICDIYLETASKFFYFWFHIEKKNATRFYPYTSSYLVHLQSPIICQMLPS